MNNYALQEIQLGLKEYFEVTITKDMLASFQTITGDSNPLHSKVSPNPKDFLIE